MMTAPTLTRELGELLRGFRNPDGGWAYYAGKTSRLEPTCWALLALGDTVDGEVLRRWPASDGLLLEHAGGRPNYGFQGLALMILLHRNIEHQRGNRALVAAIQRVKGIALPDSQRFRQDNSLQGWSWIPETFSWVEPTAYCLLALKKARGAGMPIDTVRIRDAEALLFDRTCAGGGWNFGNSRVLGQDLPAYVPTTALALLALQDRTSEAAFASSRTLLEKDALSEPSSMALSLALLALRVLGKPAPGVRSALEKQMPKTLALANHHAMAMALFALRTDHQDAPFVL